MSAILFNQSTAFGGVVDGLLSSPAKIPAPIMVDMIQRGYVEAKPPRKKAQAPKRPKGEGSSG